MFFSKQFYENLKKNWEGLLAVYLYIYQPVLKLLVWVVHKVKAHTRDLIQAEISLRNGTFYVTLHRSSHFPPRTQQQVIFCPVDQGWADDSS